MKSSTFLKRSKGRLDKFFSLHLKCTKIMKSYHQFIKIMLVLSHEQSVVECSFSLGKSLIAENILEESIRNKKLIKGCVRYILLVLFLESKREHLSN